ncbi:MAG: type II toxin-antitoxin system VapC family toxin [Blastocatellales bacterium]
MKITIDASVFVAAARSVEPHYADSVNFLEEAQAAKVEIICPTLVLAECCAAVARRIGDTALALRTVGLIEKRPGLRLVRLTTVRARRAAQSAAYQRLRGADSIYVATAEEFAATLITWDGEMLKRSAAVVSAMTPVDWLKAQQTSSNQPQ